MCVIALRGYLNTFFLLPDLRSRFVMVSLCSPSITFFCILLSCLESSCV